eukprot:m.12456 g.12456  ORF g.12456 m.12456 type:complete len:62 (+) comp24066_c0_seq1:373-558(+)
MNSHGLSYLCNLVFLGFAPLLRLSPPPVDQDYFFNLEESEGVCDLFDVPTNGQVTFSTSVS